MKRYAFILGLLLLAGCRPGTSRVAQSLPPPTLPANLAVRPYIRLNDGKELQAGTAFAATLDGSKPILLTALHLFGEAGGLQHDIPAQSLPDEVKDVTLFDMEYGSQLGTAGRGLLHDGYPMRDDGPWVDCSGDLVAFQLPDGVAIGSAPLAPQNPVVGERVWIVGKEYREKGPTANLYSGTVAEVSGGVIALEEDTPFDGTGFSGGPVVNAKGEVVGTVIGSAQKFGKKYSLLNPIAAIRKRLKAANIGS